MIKTDLHKLKRLKGLNSLKNLSTGAVVSFVGLAAQSALADNYTYQCSLRLPLQGGYSYEYVVKATANYDLDRLKLTGIMNPSISVYVAKDGVRTQTYVLDQSLEIASIGDRFALLDYKQAAFSLNARLSLAEGPLAATAKVYHVYEEGSRVSTTSIEKCDVVAN